MSERKRALEAELDRAKRSLERTELALHARGPAPLAGDILFRPGGDDPEWLVVERGDEADTWWVVALDDSDATIVLDDDVAGAVSLNPESRFLVGGLELGAMSRSGVLSDAQLERVKLALPRTVAVVRDKAVQRSKREMPRWPLAVAACVLISGLAALLGRGAEREHPGLYRLRSAQGGEVGAELRVGNGVCRARGVLDSDVCVFKAGAKVAVEYRLDRGMDQRHVLIVGRPEGSGEHVVFSTKEPLIATEVDDRERCDRGFCPLTQVEGEAGELWVVFLPDAPSGDSLPKTEPWDWPGAVPYRFVMVSR